MEVERTFAAVEAVAGAYIEALLAVDVDVLDGGAGERLVRLVARVERAEAVCRSRLVRRATEANRWCATGDRSPGEWLARSTGTTVGRARATLALADHLAAAPGTEAALAAGVVSAEQAAEVAAAARVVPGAEGRLLAAAQRESLGELARRARAVRAAASDETGRRERIRRGRYLRHWTDREGAFCFAGRGLPEDGARLLAALKPHQTAASTAPGRRGCGRRPTPTRSTGCSPWPPPVRVAGRRPR